MRNRVRSLNSFWISLFVLIGVAASNEPAAPFNNPPRVVITPTALPHYVPGPASVSIILEGDTLRASRFEFLVSFQPRNMISFAGVKRGALLDSMGWEYFSFERLVDADGQADSLIRIIGVASLHNNPTNPPTLAIPNGELAVLQFRVTSDCFYLASCSRLKFEWQSCMDNVFLNPLGDSVYAERAVYEWGGALLWDELDNAGYPDSLRPSGIGVADSCLAGDLQRIATRQIEFQNDALCADGMIPCESPGDVNFNNIFYEIGDAILFRDYFIFGSAIFNPVYKSIQVLQTDANSDGTPLTLADFETLIRVVVGDLCQGCYPKLLTTESTANIRWRFDKSRLSVDWASRTDAGGILLVFDHNGGAFGTPVLAGVADGMQVVSHDDGQQLRVLVYSFEAGKKLSPGDGTLLAIPILSPTSGLQLSAVEAAGYWGESIEVTAAESRAVPRGFTLQQNVPNPFNAGTTFRFTIPEAGPATLTVSDILGRTVATLIDGPLEAGSHTIEWDARDSRGRELASGVYFYRLTSTGTQECRKMVLQK